MEDIKVKKGDISVEVQNIFPVIKKWLYSDKEIFLRELVSNACDAVTKHKRLVSLGETEKSDVPYRIDVILDKEIKTLTISDNGIGMDADEVDKYINQIALSGALDFIEKYEGENGDVANGIIGHFGLGFYSAFMVADTVEIKSKSYKSGAEAVWWKGSDNCEYEMQTIEKDNRGTDVILNINDDEAEFLSAYKIDDILKKFCSFMPVEIYFTDVNAKKDDEKKDEDEKEKKEPQPINDTTPLWQKKPSDCTEEEYNEFYKKVFNDYKKPLFYVHINAEYPLNFKGILYFPQLSHEFDNLEGQVKLYYNQVFVADNIKEVIPEYLLVMKGVLDCPELPLNVSRSYLQANGYVNKISTHISKKIADKLNSMYNLERERFEEIWNDIKPFAEYGCMKDDKFYSKVKDILLFKTTEGKYLSLKQYTDAEKAVKDSIYYTNDEVSQSRYISMFKNEGIDVLVLDKLIDTQFIGFLEHKFTESDDYKETKFKRVDSGISDVLKDNGEVGDNEKLCEFIKSALENEGLKITCEKLKDKELPAVLNISEEQRRFSEMMKMYSGGKDGMMPTEETLVLNLNNPLVAKINQSFADSEKEELSKKLAKQVYMLALIAQRQLSAEELKSFISENANLLESL